MMQISRTIESLKMYIDDQWLAWGYYDPYEEDEHPIGDGYCDSEGTFHYYKDKRRAEIKHTNPVIVL